MPLFLRNGSSEGGEQPKENDNEVSELQQKGNISVPTQPPLLLTMQRSLSPFIFERRFRPVYCYCLVLIGPGCGLENRETCKEIKIFSFPCIENIIMDNERIHEQKAGNKFPTVLSRGLVTNCWK